MSNNIFGNFPKLFFGQGQSFLRLEIFLYRERFLWFSKVSLNLSWGRGNHISLLNYTLLIFFLETLLLKYYKKNELVYYFIILGLVLIFRRNRQKSQSIYEPYLIGWTRVYSIFVWVHCWVGMYQTFSSHSTKVLLFLLPFPYSTIYPK